MPNVETLAADGRADDGEPGRERLQDLESGAASGFEGDRQETFTAFCAFESTNFSSGTETIFFVRSPCPFPTLPWGQRWRCRLFVERPR